MGLFGLVVRKQGREGGVLGEERECVLHCYMADSEVELQENFLDGKCQTILIG